MRSIQMATELANSPYRTLPGHLEDAGDVKVHNVDLTDLANTRDLESVKSLLANGDGYTAASVRGVDGRWTEGAWRWLDRYNIGIVSELDAEVANAGGRSGAAGVVRVASAVERHRCLRTGATLLRWATAFESGR